MAPGSNSRQSPDGGPVVIAAPSLQTAHRRIRERFGDDAVILSTRSVTRRHELGLGQDRGVEVTVQPPGSGPSRGRSWQARPVAVSDAAGIPDELMREIDRIETLVERVAADYERGRNDEAWLSRDAVAGPLLACGVSTAVVRRLLARCAATLGHAPRDAGEFRGWLTTQLRASNCGWDGFYGCHAFLGDSGCGRSDLVLAAASRLQALGRKTLVMAALPSDPGHVHRLQEAAGVGGYDAAVVNEARHLTEAEPHFAGYDAVLVELPRLDDPAMALGGALHVWLAPHTGFHRHLVVAADRDPADQSGLPGAVRDWNCDWVAFSRLDRTTRPGKLLDLLETVPLAVSLVGRDPLHGGDLAVGASAALAALMVPTAAPAAGRLDRGVLR